MSFEIEGRRYKLIGEPKKRGALITQFAIDQENGQQVWIKVVPKVTTRKSKRNVWKKQNQEEEGRGRERRRENGELLEVQLTLGIVKLLPKHPNVSSLLGVVETDNFYYCVCLPPKEGSVSLSHFLGESFQSFSESSFFVVFHQLLAAISFFHKHLVWHSDLSLDNIYITENLEIQIQNLGVSLLYHHEKDPTSSLYAGEGSFSFLADNFAYDLQQVGHLSVALASGRSLHNDHHSQGHHPLPHPNISDLPVSGKLKHLLVRMVGTEAEKRFGVQDVVIHPWYRTMAVSQRSSLPPSSQSLISSLGGRAGEEVAAEAVITQLHNHNDPVRSPGPPLLNCVGFLGMPKAIANALASREVNHVKIFVVCAGLILPQLSEENRSILTSSVTEPFFSKLKSPCPRLPIVSEVDEDEKVDDLLIKALRFDTALDMMRLKKRREQRKRAYLDSSSLSEASVHTLELSPETKTLHRDDYFFKDNYSALSRRAFSFLQLEGSKSVLSNKIVIQMKRKYSKSFWRQFIPDSVPDFESLKEKENCKEKEKEKEKEKRSARKRKEKKKEREREREREKKSVRHFVKYYPKVNFEVCIGTDCSIDPSSVKYYEGESKDEYLKCLARETPSKGDLRSTFFQGSGMLAPSLKLERRSSLTSNVSLPKLENFLPCFPRLVVPYRSLRRRANSTSSLFVRSTIDIMDMEEMMRCGSYALFVIITYCFHHKKSLSILDIFHEDIYPLVKEDSGGEIPDPKTIFDFCFTIFQAEDVRSDVMIMCVYFVERLVFSQRIAFHPSTWRRVLFGLILISTKYWEELSIWNTDFTGHVPLADPKELQDLEIALLKFLNFEMIAPGTLFTKYYFALRSLSISNQLLPPTPLTLRETKVLFERQRKISGNPRKMRMRPQSLLGSCCSFDTPVALN